MKILFLVFHGFSDINGISKKIFAQVNGLKAIGNEVMLVSYPISENRNRVRMINNEIVEEYGKGKIAAIKKKTCYHSLYNYIIQNKISLVYMRSYHNANPFTIHLFNKINKAGIKTVMEIPTYPYDNEYEGFNLTDRLELQIDKIFRKRLVKQIDKIITFSHFDTILGKETIKISNGIDFSQITLKTKKNNNPKIINMVGVAEVHYWHGYDRVIAGLGEYYQQTSFPKEVYFHIVGGIGPSEMYNSKKAPGFSELIKKYNLDKYIIFHGQLSGKKLDEIFNQCDIGIGSLGRHRCKITQIKTLKNREYAARGIPFVYSEIDEDFEDKPYVIKAPADESPLDIKRILDFYDELTITTKEIRNSINDLSWKKQMQKVIDNIF